MTLERALLTLSHRRLILPSNSRISVKILESKVNMALDGVTQCEVSWDMQGASPVLQVTGVGKTLEETEHEDKRSVEVRNREERIDEPGCLKSTSVSAEPPPCNSNSLRSIFMRLASLVASLVAGPHRRRAAARGRRRR